MKFLLCTVVVMCLMHQALGNYAVTLDAIDTSEGSVYFEYWRDPSGERTLKIYHDWDNGIKFRVKYDDDLGTFEGDFCEKHPDPKGELARVGVMKFLAAGDCPILQGEYHPEEVEVEVEGDILGEYTYAALTLWVPYAEAKLEGTLSFDFVK